MNAKTGGMVAAGCGGLMMLTALVAVAVFGYIGLEGRGRDEDIAFPLAGGSCCCSLVSLLIVGVGIFFALKKPAAPTM